MNHGCLYAYAHTSYLSEESLPLQLFLLFVSLFLTGVPSRLTLDWSFCAWKRFLWLIWRIIDIYRIFSFISIFSIDAHTILEILIRAANFFLFSDLISIEVYWASPSCVITYPSFWIWIFIVFQRISRLPLFDFNSISPATWCLTYSHCWTLSLFSLVSHSFSSKPQIQPSGWALSYYILSFRAFQDGWGGPFRSIRKGVRPFSFLSCGQWGCLGVWVRNGCCWERNITFIYWGSRCCSTFILRRARRGEKP